jgi:hypothetical protein
MYTDCSSVRSDVVVTRSKGTQVPTEVWLEILSGPHEYAEFPRILRVCKGFKDILKVRCGSQWKEGARANAVGAQARRFDGPLFRSPPPAKPIEKGDEIKVHPILGHINCLFTEFKDIEIYNGPGDDYAVVKDLPCIKDFATYPAVKCIRLNFNLMPVKRINSETGVTVKQLLVAFRKQWGAKPPASYRTPWFDGDEFENWAHVVCERNGFHGFYDATIGTGGVITMGQDVNTFDS